jgi:hypothetical protein
MLEKNRRPRPTVGGQLCIGCLNLTVKIMTQSSPDRLPPPRYYGLLWSIALASLLMNVALAAVLLNSRAQLQAGAATLAAALDDVNLNDMALTIAIDETAPVSLTIPYSDTFRVPIRETIFVSTDILFEDVIQVPINTIIPIDTDFIVQVGHGSS